MRDEGEVRSEWATYLAETPTYGTYWDRRPEYQAVWDVLHGMGLGDGDLIVDVGAGPCDMDRFLRTEARWNGRYWPIDGAVQGVDFREAEPCDYLPRGRVDWLVCIETIEHVPRKMNLLEHLIDRAGKGLVVTTPNGEVLDVASLDPTHCDSYDRDEFLRHRMRVEGRCFSPDRAQPDTLIAWRQS